MIITGAAASGKSTVASSLADRDGLLALDGDVLAGGAAAVADGRRDYVAFWKFLLDIASEVQQSNCVPAYACICEPEQVLVNPEIEHFTGIYFLALVCSDETLRERIVSRPGACSAVANLEFHLDFNRRLRSESVQAPHSFMVLDTSDFSHKETVSRARTWADKVLIGSPPSIG